jgi:hypothetical protein
MFSDYLINCCCRHELGVSYLSEQGFNGIAFELIKHWEYVSHHNKYLVSYDNLKKSSSGAYIRFPTLVRQAACKLAVGLPGGPFYKQSHAFIMDYCDYMMGEMNNTEYEGMPEVVVVPSEDRERTTLVP